MSDTQRTMTITYILAFYRFARMLALESYAFYVLGFFSAVCVEFAQHGQLV